MTASPSALRLLYFAGKSFPGAMAGVMHTDLLDHLAAHRVEATLVARGPAAQRQALTTTLEGGRRTLRFAPTAAPTDRVLNAISKYVFHYDYFLSGVRRLTAIVRHEPFDILQAQMAYPYGAMAAAALRLSGRQEPLIVTLAGGDLIDSAEARYGYARFTTVRAFLRATFHQAALVRANSPLMGARAATLGCPLERLRIVPSNIATALLPPEALPAFRHQSRAWLRATQAVPDGPVLLAAGRLAAIKGLDWLVRALPVVAARWPTLTVLIAGPPVAGEAGYADRLLGEAARLRVARHLRLLGEVPPETMRGLYAAADLLIVASLFEGLNKTGIEAGANGTPCVATASTGLADYILAYGAGLVVPPRDPTALAEAIGTLLADRRQWTGCAQGARRMAGAFTPAAVARALVPLYAAALAPGHPWQAAEQPLAPPGPERDRFVALPTMTPSPGSLTVQRDPIDPYGNRPTPTPPWHNPDQPPAVAADAASQAPENAGSPE